MVNSKQVWRFSTIGSLIMISVALVSTLPSATAASQRPAWVTWTETNCVIDSGHYGVVTIEMRSRNEEPLTSYNFQCGNDQQVLIGLVTPERPSKFQVELTIVESSSGDEIGDVFDGTISGKPQFISVLDGDTGNEISTTIFRPAPET